MKESTKSVLNKLSDKDRLIFTLLIRTIRELRCIKNLPKVYSSTEKVITRCLYSRNSHYGESFYENISFWPQELRIQSK